MVEHRSILIHSPPKILLDAVDPQKDFVQVPLRSQLPLVSTKLAALLADIGQLHTAPRHHLRHIAVAHR